MTEEDFHKMLNKELDAVKAIVFGQLKIKGNVGEAYKFNSGFLAPYFGTDSEFAKNERAKKGGLMVLLI